jgi:hypothetical protein
VTIVPHTATLAWTRVDVARILQLQVYSLFLGIEDTHTGDICNSGVLLRYDVRRCEWTWESPDGFTVNLDALGAARDRLVGWSVLTGLPREVPNAGVFGHRRLAEAVNEFTAREERARACLTSEAESIRNDLAETVKAYKKGDEDGAGRFRGIASWV